MGNVIISTTGAATTTGLGVAATGQAQNVGAGVLGRDGNGNGYAVSGAPAWAWWVCGTDVTVETTITTMPGAGQTVGLVARANATSRYQLEAREWGDIVLTRWDTSKNAPNSWAEGDSYQRQSQGAVFIAGDKVGLKIAGGVLQVLVNGSPVPLHINMVAQGTSVTDPTPLTGNGVGPFVSAVGAGRFGSVTGTDAAAVSAVDHVRSVTDYVTVADAASASNTSGAVVTQPVAGSGLQQLVMVGGQWLKVAVK